MIEQRTYCDSEDTAHELFRQFREQVQVLADAYNIDTFHLASMVRYREDGEYGEVFGHVADGDPTELLKLVTHAQGWSRTRFEHELANIHMDGELSSVVPIDDEDVLEETHVRVGSGIE